MNELLGDVAWEYGLEEEFQDSQLLRYEAGELQKSSDLLGDSSRSAISASTIQENNFLTSPSPKGGNSWSDGILGTDQNSDKTPGSGLPYLLISNTPSPYSIGIGSPAPSNFGASTPASATPVAATSSLTVASSSSTSSSPSASSSSASAPASGNASSSSNATANSNSITNIGFQNSHNANGTATNNNTNNNNNNNSMSINVLARGSNSSNGTPPANPVSTQINNVVSKMASLVDPTAIAAQNSMESLIQASLIHHATTNDHSSPVAMEISPLSPNSLVPTTLSAFMRPFYPSPTPPLMYPPLSPSTTSSSATTPASSVTEGKPTARKETKNRESSVVKRRKVAASPKGGGDTDSSDTSPVSVYPPLNDEERRRMAHIQAEQKRRNTMKNGFACLKKVVPEIRDKPSVSKAVILKKATEYITKLELDRDELLKLRRENADLRMSLENIKPKPLITQPFLIPPKLDARPLPSNITRITSEPKLHHYFD